MRKTSRLGPLVATLLIFLSLGVGFVSGLGWAYYRGDIRISSDLPPLKSLFEYQRNIDLANQLIATLSAELVEAKNQPPETVMVPYTPPSNPQGGGQAISFTGEDLWQAVNKYRRETGVPELKLHPELCQLSSRRLGEILDLGELDNHAGFEKFFEDKSVRDLGLGSVAENLASGYSTAWDTVMGWDSSPPHRTFLLADGSYVYGCTSANRGFAVLIAGYE